MRWRGAVECEGGDVDSEWDGPQCARYSVTYRHRVVRSGRDGRSMNHK